VNYKERPGGCEQAGRLFNAETGGHGRDARATKGKGGGGSRCARLAPLSPLSCALRASALHDAISVLPSHLDSAKRTGLELA
jgi:hypothetical protein